MNEGWIKLHRKTQYNEIWKHDWTAWHIFEGLLMFCDRNGKWSGGRKVLAARLEMNESTVYKALKRLEANRLVTLSSNSRFTTIRICNWKKYQQDGNSFGNSTVTAREHYNKNKNRNIYRDSINEFDKLPPRLDDEELVKSREKLKEVREAFFSKRGKD